MHRFVFSSVAAPIAAFGCTTPRGDAPGAGDAALRERIRASTSAVDGVLFATGPWSVVYASGTQATGP